MLRFQIGASGNKLAFERSQQELGLVAHVYDSSTMEEAGRQSIGGRPAWLNTETLSQKTDQQQKSSMNMKLSLYFSFCK